MPDRSAEPPSSRPARIVEAVIRPRVRDLGGFSVRRVLPAAERRMVGPFIFFDQMGPAVFAPGTGIDVRPHPHIGLETVTYLYEGEIIHRDSLGSLQAINPGDVNWMTAGRGIVHSERTAPERRARGASLHGLQLWVALPKEHEEAEPAFVHYPAARLPLFEAGGARGRVLAGSAFGVTSPVKTLSPLFYVDVEIGAGGEVAVPEGYEERAAYVAEGEIDGDAGPAGAGTLLVFVPGARAVLRASRPARVAFVGGAPMDGERHLSWNFVSSSAGRIEQARRDWKEGRFPKVPGDAVEFIPLPE